MTDNELKNWAFLSYSQLDNCADTQDMSRRCWGNWMLDALKTFSIPAEFVGQINGRGEIIPEQIQPIFQDEQELPGDADLSAEVRQALEQSRCLVVICSPRSAQSRHVNEVVRYFKQLGRDKFIFPIVVAGEPNASGGNKPGVAPEDECFVPALRHPVQPDGTLDTSRPAGKFIFVDARHGADQREILAENHRLAEADLAMAKIQLIAVLIGVGFNGLWSREQKRHFVDLAETRDQVRQARHQVEEAQRQLQEAQRQTREAQNKVLEVQNLPRDVHSQIQEAQIRADEAQSQVREAQKQLQEFQDKARNTQGQLDEARQRVLAVESKLLEAQNQAREAQRQAAETQIQLQEVKNQVQAVPSESEETQRQAEEARRQVQTLQNQTEQAQTEVQAAQIKAQEAENQAREAEQQLQAFQTKFQDSQNQLAEARNEILAAESKLLAAENLVRETQRQFDEARLQVQPQAEAAPGKIHEAQIQIRQARRLTTVLALVTLIALLVASIAWWQRKITSQVLAKPAEDETNESDLAQGKMDQEQIQHALQKLSATRPDANRSLDELAARISPPENLAAIETASTNLAEPQRSYFQLAVLDNWMKTDLSGARDWVRQLPDVDLRNRALGKIIPSLATDNATNTLALLNDLKPAPGEESYTLLFQSWATNDPVQAIQQRQQIPDHDADDQILRTILTTWVNQQSDAAVNWVKAQPDSESKDRMLEICIRALENSDFPKALALAESLPEGDWRSMMIVGLFSDWSTRDLAAATTACQQLPDDMAKEKAWAYVLNQKIAKDPASASVDVTNLPPGNFRQNAIEELCQRWTNFDTGTNIPAVVTWAQSLSAEAEQTAAINQVVTNWASKDPQAAMQFANQHSELSGDALAGIAEALAKSDFPAATNWVSSLPVGEKKDKALLALSGTWVQTDPKGMATYALGLPAGDDQTQYLTAACRQLAIHDLPGMVELLKPLADVKLRQNILEQVSHNCDLLHMDQAAKYIAAMPASDDQQALIKGLLSTWSPADPATAVNWLEAFPATNSRPEQVQSIIKAWSQTEPADVAKWLANLPAGTNNEEMANAFLEGAGEKYSKFVAQWTQSVTNETQRQKYQVKVARQWMKTDPSAALKWINSLDLPEAIKQSLKAQSPSTEVHLKSNLAS